MRKLSCVVFTFALLFAFLPSIVAGDAPQWMHDAAARTVPTQDDRTDAVLLYADQTVKVDSADAIRTHVRMAYKILKPGGRRYGNVGINFDFSKKIISLGGWCIPAQGKDYEVKQKESMDIALPMIEGSELISDVRYRVFHIPAPDPGNVVGYEYEIEEHPMLLQSVWDIQQSVPVLESHYSLVLPAGWEYKTVWLNAPEIKPVQNGDQLQWAVAEQKAIREEEDMPPSEGIAASLVLLFVPPDSSAAKGVTNWQELGIWHSNLYKGRTDASPEIKQKVADLTAGAPDSVAKMKAIAKFLQHDIRYVAIELGIGGWQPHAAKDVFINRYGDCKDKSTLMISMLHEVGIDAYHLAINTKRGSINPSTPPHLGFNHVILAIKLPRDVNESFSATIQHPKLGKLLIFDPTSELTPFGEVRGPLQANYGLLVSPDGGELVEVPQQPASMNGIKRTAKFALTTTGTLTGEVEEARRGDRAWVQRWNLRNARTDQERIKPIESLLASSLPNFQMTQASVVNFTDTDKPFGFLYKFTAERYAKNAGGLLLVRPRVIGTKSSAILETDRPRQYPIEFDAPVKDEDIFEIQLPAGYEVDELPPPVNAEYSFASYHSKTEAKGNSIIYTRTFEIKELSVPVKKSEELKKFYRIIAGDERNTAVLRPKQ